jgi:hypothetical protein
MATTTQGIINSALQDAVKPVTMQTTQQPTAADPTQPGQATTATPTTTAAAYNPTKVADPTKWEINNQQTVAGQVKSLIDDNSPIIQQARTNAKQAANERGLMNSAMAVSAGESAAYQAALPIAQQDAQTYSQAAGYNADQMNQGNTKNAEFTNAAAQFNASAINDATLQQVAEQNKVLLQSNSQAADLMNQATGVINNIMMNEKMDAASKTEASRQIYENLRTQLNIIGATAGLDLASLLGENPYQSFTAIPEPAPTAPPDLGGGDPWVS